MDLITESFKRTTDTTQEPTSAPTGPEEQSAKGGETTECISQDATLLELQTEVKSTKSLELKRKRRTKPIRQPSRRRVPMREEFFAKIGWTRCFISGPADPLHNPQMVWCHICKINFSIKTKGQWRFFVTIALKGI